jgi:hypothetical protein
MNRVALVVAVVIGAVPLSAFAQFPEGKGSGGANRAWSEKKPYADLFITPDAQKPDTQRTVPKPFELFSGGAVAAPPRVVCGMTVLQADPSVDPRILRKPGVETAGRGTLKPNLPRNNPEYKIRKVEPPVCY